MREDVKQLLNELEKESIRINDESQFSIGDKVKVIDSFNKNDIGMIGEIKSRKDFHGGRVIQFNDGTLKQFDELELMKL